MRLISKTKVFTAYGIALMGTLPSCTPTDVIAPPSIAQDSRSAPENQGEGRPVKQAATLLELQEKPSGMPDNFVKDIELYRKKAEKGDAGGQFNLGQVYNQGLGVREDYAQAVDWYRKAAEQGHAKAQYNLGYMYALGLGVPQDLVQAFMWITLASRQGLEKAIVMRGDFANNLTPSQIEEGQHLASEWAAMHPGSVHPHHG